MDALSVSRFAYVAYDKQAAQAYINEKMAAARLFNIWRIGRVYQRDAAVAALGE